MDERERLKKEWDRLDKAERKLILLKVLSEINGRREKREKLLNKIHKEKQEV
jgi:hypothetical protein